MDDPLSAAVQGLLLAARERALQPDTRTTLDTALRRLREPLRLAFAGRVKAGKSTLLNALVGEELAPTDAGECTRLVTWYLGAPSPQVLVHLRDGRRVPRAYVRERGPIEIDLGHPPEDVDHLEIRWPSARLTDLTLIDTPGVDSLSTDVSLRAQALLPAQENQPGVADALIYLLRHVHASDVRFLDAFQDEDLAQGTPVNCLGVLSRADELGACRGDALEVAARIADRYAQDRRIRGLCPQVLPMAGLLAHAGTTLREEEFRVAALIARLSEPEIHDLLLTADRVVRDEPRLVVTAVERRQLLDRLGLFGVRLCVDLIRRGEAGNAQQLARQLTRRSGLDRLRSLVLSQFAERSRLLKCSSALGTARAVIRGGGCAEAALLENRWEQVVSSAHEFTEIRLLDDIRSGAVQVPEQYRPELERLLGGSGHAAISRLGLPAPVEPEQVRAAALQALSRWQRLAESPLAARPLKRAARAAARSCEGMLAALPAP